MSDTLICSRCQGMIENNQQRYVKTRFDTYLHEDYKDCFDAVHRMLHSENAANEWTRKQFDNITAIVNYFAPEYPGTKEKLTTFDKLSVILNTHIADRYKNGLVFLGHVNGNPVYQWIANVKNAEQAQALLEIFAAALALNEVGYDAGEGYMLPKPECDALDREIKKYELVST